VRRVTLSGHVKLWRSLRSRSSGSCGGRPTCRDRESVLIEDICCEKIRGCSYRGCNTSASDALINRDCGAPANYRTSGSLIRNDAPPWSRFLAHISPSCASTMVRAMDNPMPMPSALPGSRQWGHSLPYRPWRSQRLYGSMHAQEMKVVMRGADKEDRAAAAWPRWPPSLSSAHDCAPHSDYECMPIIAISGQCDLKRLSWTWSRSVFWV